MADNNDNTLQGKYRKRYTQLRDQQDSWRSHWKDISDYLFPRKGRYLTNTQAKTNEGASQNQKIINGSGTSSVKVLGSGMQGGLTSPSTPWFVLSLADKDLVQYKSVKVWLNKVRDLMLSVFAKSNFYSAVTNIYSELGAFGTAAMIEEEDLDTVIKFRPFTIGEFALALGNDYKVDTLYRQFTMIARDMVDKFGEDNVSDMVLQSVARGSIDDKYEILHCIQPNESFDITKEDVRGKRFESVYLEYNGNTDKFLRKGGYDSIPFVAPRWDVTGSETYGNSPGMLALGDLKMLQKVEEKKLKALDKMVDPPMNAPVNMKGKALTIVAGGVNYVDAAQGQQGFTPVYQVNPAIQDIRVEIMGIEERIGRFFFNPLFMALLGEQKAMTATEVVARQREKMALLGPVIERLQTEFLNNIIERTYQIMDSFGMIPPASEELAGVEIRIEYVSILTQAQKLAGTNSIEQVAAFVGNIASIKPDVLDKLDADEAVDQYSEMVGVSPEIIVSDSEVARIREERARLQQMQQAQQVATNAIDNAKTLSETEATPNSALTGVMDTINP